MGNNEQHVTADEAWRHARDVFQALENHHVCPTPENYTIWFQHIAGLNTTLSKEINAQIAKDDAFDPVYLQHLYTRYATDSEQTIHQSQTLHNTQNLLNDALSVIGDIINETDTHNTHLQKKLDTIIDTKDNDLNTVISALMTVATEMKKSSTHVQSSLRESRREVEGLKKALADVSVEAQQDFLTGVSNRKALDLRINALTKQATEHNTPLSMILIDIDYFKKFNDNYGHLIGDEVLKMVAKVMTSMVKGRDMIARFGGEEFVVLLPETHIGGAMVVAENIRQTIAGKELLNRASGDSYGYITISAGVAIYKNEDGSPEKWIERADEALYRSKRSGRNKVTQEHISL